MRKKQPPRAHCWHPAGTEPVEESVYLPKHTREKSVCCWCASQKTRSAKWGTMPGHGPHANSKEAVWTTQIWDTWKGEWGNDVCRGFSR